MKKMFIRCFALAFVSSVLVACSSSGNGEGGSKLGQTSCAFTVSGDHTGTFGGGVATIETTSYAFLCSNLVGNVHDVPRMQVEIDKTLFTGPGTYDLTQAAGQIVRFTFDGTTYYRSTSTSSNCQAVFLTATSFSVSCDNLEREGGGGQVSISSGSWSE